MAKSFTPITLLESELKQWEADLKACTDKRYMNDTSLGTHPVDEQLKPVQACNISAEEINVKTGGLRFW